MLPCGSYKTDPQPHITQPLFIPLKFVLIPLEAFLDSGGILTYGFNKKSSQNWFKTKIKGV